MNKKRFLFKRPENGRKYQLCAHLPAKFLTTNGVNAAQESVATCNSINNNVDSDCPGFFKTEYWYYYGEDISGSYQNSYADCCRQCTQNDKCNAFSWSRLTKACFLKSGINSGGYSSEDNDSGRRLNIGTNTTGCSGFVKTENWVLYSEDIGATYQNSYADCCQQCSLNNKCNAFIWGRQSKACYLKSSVGDGGRAGADVDTGVRLTTVTETIDFSTFTKTENWVLYSEDIGATYQNSYANCNQQCSLNNKCNAFIWGRDSKACYLKSGVGDGGRAGAGVDAGRRLGKFKDIGNDSLLRRKQSYDNYFIPRQKI
ncbi:unnamed protein product [Adineta ricciae]|uniref:Apple domain-containing protein n=1 Tax=Adineta ricciae TaxID=249248 RepID=A0A815I1S4_ADIRI|nr:unnamed protein product [Adineta ricciae]